MTAAAPTAEDSPAKEWRANSLLIPWLLIALTPVLFALATWDAVNGGVNRGQFWVRLFGVPVVAVELCIIVYAIAVGAQPLRTLGRQPLWVQAALVAITAIALFTAFAAPAPVTALSWTFIWLVHLMFGICTAALWRRTDERHRARIWPAIVAGLCGYVLILLAYVNAVEDPRIFPWERLWLGVTNIRQVGFYSAAGGAAALGLAVTARRWNALAWCAAAALLLALSFWTGTRGALLAVWAAFALGLVGLPWLRSVRAWGMLIGSTVAGAMLSLVQPIPYGLYGLGRVASASQGSIEALTSGRATMWVKTWHTILERPLLGHGQGQFRWIADESLRMFNHPHNVVLQLLFQWGFIATIGFAALAGFVAWRCRDALRQPSDEAAPAFLVAASLLVLSLYDGAFFYSYPLMMIALSLAVMTGASREVRRA